MKQWLRENYILTYEDINAGRTDWWQRREARVEELKLVPDSLAYTSGLSRCLYREDSAARMGAILQLLQSGEAWVENTVGDLGLDTPLVTNNGGLGSQIYAGIWDDIFAALDAETAAGANTMRSELEGLAAIAKEEIVAWVAAAGSADSEEYLGRFGEHPDGTALLCASVLLGRLNRAKHWLEVAMSEDTAGEPSGMAAFRKRCQSQLGMLRHIEARLSEGRPLDTSVKAELFMGITPWDPAYCYVEKDKVLSPPYVRL